MVPIAWRQQVAFCGRAIHRAIPLPDVAMEPGAAQHIFCFDA
jgi:hypothetical protein